MFCVSGVSWYASTSLQVVYSHVSRNVEPVAHTSMLTHKQSRCYILMVSREVYWTTQPLNSGVFSTSAPGEWNQRPHRVVTPLQTFVKEWRVLKSYNWVPPLQEASSWNFFPLDVSTITWKWCYCNLGNSATQPQSGRPCKVTERGQWVLVYSVWKLQTLCGLNNTVPNLL